MHFSFLTNYDTLFLNCSFIVHSCFKNMFHVRLFCTNIYLFKVSFHVLISLHIDSIFHRSSVGQIKHCDEMFVTWVNLFKRSAFSLFNSETAKHWLIVCDFHMNEIMKYGNINMDICSKANCKQFIWPSVSVGAIMAILACSAISMYEISSNLHKMCLSDSYILLYLIYDFWTALFKYQFRTVKKEFALFTKTFDIFIGTTG